MNHKRHVTKRKLVTRYNGPRSAWCDVLASRLPPKPEVARAQAKEREQRAEMLEGEAVYSL